MNKLFIFFILSCQFIIGQNKLIHEVYFETDKFEVLPTETNRLLLFISKLSDIDIESISIYGFCDDRGAAEYNLILSQERANAIKAIFANNEISESLITNVDGKGEILLKIVNEKDVIKIRGLNRKVEIIVKPKPKKTKEEEAIEAKKIAEASSKKKDVPEIIKDKNLKIGDKVLFENILFKTGYSTMVPKSKTVLAAIAKSLIERDDIYFTIQGHVCCTQLSRDAVDRKTKKRNLSVARAKFVYDYFVKKGINPKRMKYVGLRRLFPLGGDPQFDRRVEILITYVKAP